MIRTRQRYTSITEACRTLQIRLLSQYLKTNLNINPGFDFIVDMPTCYLYFLLQKSYGECKI
jgi:hypothetical protein